MIALQRFVLLGWLGWAGVVLSAPPVVAGPWRVRVQGNGTDLAAAPVVVRLREPVPLGAYELRPSGGGEPTPAQVFRDGDETFLAVILGRVPARSDQEYVLRPGADAGPSGVELRREGDNVAVRVGGAPLTEYLPNSATKPYFFPVIGPTGAPVTRAYPMRKVDGEDRDHPHQRSLWFTHGDINGVDFWASDPINAPKPNFGTIKETARKAVLSGPVVGLLRTTDDWLGPGGKKVCEDERAVWFYNTPAVRVLDFDVTLKATDGPVTFGDTKEGMFGLRVASSMDVTKKQGGKITNAEGLTDDAAWGKPSPWVDYTGPVEGKTVGIAILNHPESFRSPTTWHVRTYGLFAANPFGWHDFGRKQSGRYVLPSGESIRFRYRVILHTGDTASARLPEQFAAYATPPAVSVRAE